MSEKTDGYFGDAIYEVWRSGGNPDAVDRGDAADAAADGIYAERAVARDMRDWEANEWDLPDNERFTR